MNNDKNDIIYLATYKDKDNKFRVKNETSLDSSVDESKVKGGYGNPTICGMGSYELARRLLQDKSEELIYNNILEYIKLGYSYEFSVELYNQSLEFINEVDLEPSLDTQISNLKSQLKHCKNPLQKLNLEREMNKLIRERNRK